MEYDVFGFLTLETWFWLKDDKDAFADCLKVAKRMADQEDSREEAVEATAVAVKQKHIDDMSEANNVCHSLLSWAIDMVGWDEIAERLMEYVDRM